MVNKVKLFVFFVLVNKGEAYEERKKQKANKEMKGGERKRAGEA